MLTKEILYGMNILSLAGFLLMGIGLTLNRQQKIGVPVAFALMLRVGRAPERAAWPRPA